MKGQDILDRLLDFAVRAGHVVDALPDTRLGRHIASQLVRCGTSPAPNYSEACAAESRADFIHKVHVAWKEINESCIWIRMIIFAKLLPAERLDQLLDEGLQLCRILAKSLITAKQNKRTGR